MNRPRTALLVAAAVALLASPALASKINIDYAHDYDFGQVESFQYVETEDSNAADSLMDRRIKAGITERLKLKGLEQVDSSPDLFVTYHLTTEDQTNYSTTSFGYGGWGPGWRGWGASVGSSTTTAHTYTKGTLIVDAYDPETKNLLWRGSGETTLKDSPEKRSRQIEKLLDDMAKKWAKILKKKAK